MRQLDLPVGVAVNLDPMPRDQRVNKVDRRQLSRAKAQPILAPCKLVQRGIAEPPAPKAAKAPVAARRAPADVSVFQHDRRIPSLRKAQRGREPCKAAPYNRHVTGYVTFQRRPVGSGAGLIPPTIFPRRICIGKIVKYSFHAAALSCHGAFRRLHIALRLDRLALRYQ